MDRPNSSKTASRPDAAAVSAGRPELPDFEVLEELGRGGMGVVYKARQHHPDRIVALKCLSVIGDEDLLSRFRREADAIGRLEHPNVVRLYQAGAWAGRPFMVMEYFPGGSLRDQLRGVPRPFADAARLTAAIARAVHAAHDRKIVHRDLKPANILLADDGTPKVADFGLAKRLDQDATLTSDGVVMGTPSYMAPEQAAGRWAEVGPAADIYGIGAILYELLTGRPPFRGADTAETLEQVLRAKPVPPGELRPGTPPGLDAVCLKCLAKRPRDRYPTAAALADDLDRWLSRGAVAARAPVQGRPWQVACATLTAVAIALLVTNIMTWRALHSSVASDDPEALRRYYLEEAKKPGIEGVHAQVKLNELEVPNRVAALRRLVEISPDRWPEAEAALIGALRGDRNEAVRLEAALALGKATTTGKHVIEALSICATGSARDAFPPESSALVRQAALAALEPSVRAYNEGREPDARIELLSDKLGAISIPDPKTAPKRKEVPPPESPK
jgi:serine/threonine protein kinase